MLTSSQEKHRKAVSSSEHRAPQPLHARSQGHPPLHLMKGAQVLEGRAAEKGPPTTHTPDLGADAGARLAPQETKVRVLCGDGHRRGRRGSFQRKGHPEEAPQHPACPSALPGKRPTSASSLQPPRRGPEMGAFVHCGVTPSPSRCECYELARDPG